MSTSMCAQRAPAGALTTTSSARRATWSALRTRMSSRGARPSRAPALKVRATHGNCWPSIRTVYWRCAETSGKSSCVFELISVHRFLCICTSSVLSFGCSVVTPRAQLERFSFHACGLKKFVHLRFSTFLFLCFCVISAVFSRLLCLLTNNSVCLVVLPLRLSFDRLRHACAAVQARLLASGTRVAEHCRVAELHGCRRGIPMRA